MESHSMNTTIFSGFIRLKHIIHRLHDEELHTYQTKATRFKYNCFIYLLTSKNLGLWENKLFYSHITSQYCQNQPQCK